jgi:predicted N-acetyltransferase YhbS
MMKTKQTSYDEKKHYNDVYQMLTEAFPMTGAYVQWMPPRWEYMHYHPNLNRSELSKIGIWTEDDRIVGVATYEDNLGDAYLATLPTHRNLRNEMVQYAQQHLHKKQKNGDGYLRIFCSDCDNELEAILKENNFKKDCTFLEYRGVTQWDTRCEIPSIDLPSGYRLKSLQVDNDLQKIDRVLWRGFNHPGEPPLDGLNDRKLMQSTPNYDLSLNFVVENPKGEFVSYSGVWLVPTKKSAYIEPVATDPDYRRMGLGQAAVLACIHECKKRGMDRVIVESAQPFYVAMGFNKIFSIFPWTKHIKLD